jgi:DNA-3-methyladenine glycosylase II
VSGIHGIVDAMTTTTIEPRGPFSLRESATLGFGHRHDIPYDGVMRMAFCLDSYAGAAGVEVRQDDAGVHVTVRGDADPAVVTKQVARILSLDHDGAGFVEVGRRDPVLGRLQAAAPGLRPPQFHSPYEAAAWSVLSARRPARQMAQVRQRLSAAHGAGFDLAGQRWHAFPTPRALLAVEDFPGIPELKLRRLHAVARAALDGKLDVDRLTAVDPDTALAQLRELPGIGAFYASLVVIRSCGLADVLVVNEATAVAAIRDLYDFAATPTAEQIAELAETWRPFRTWAAVLLRAAAPRLAA